MTISTQLLGPPAVAGKPSVNQPETNPLPSGEPTVDSLVHQTKTLDLTGTTTKPPMGLTENLSPTFLSTGNPCLDFFFHIVPDTPPDELIQRLQSAWAHDALTALKLVCNLRGVRGTGKSDKEGFYTAAFWLHNHHPKTLAFNVGALADFGYLKDFPEILYRILEGLEVRKDAKRQRSDARRAKRRHKSFSRRRRGEDEDCEDDGDSGDESEPEVEKEEAKASQVIDKETARRLRKEREEAKAAAALHRYQTDASYRVLFDSVAGLFAELLKADVESLIAKQPNKISLAAKWCPSIDSSYDKATLICEAIARRIFPRETSADYEGIEEAHYAFRVRDRLRKEVLVPLRKALELPEVFMSAREWNSVPYNRVASVAMKTYKGLFLEHDKERFEEYLEKVKAGEAKIAAGAVLPHQIIAGLKDEDGGTVAELQWARVVEDFAKKGKLKNCIAVCDVSGSMEGIPMEVCVALGLLVSELSEEPWKGKVITFSEKPEMHLIAGDTLLEKTEFIRKMDWGSNTDLQSVFDRILDVAVQNKLSEDQLIKRVFVFSDMEFDDAASANFGALMEKYYSLNPEGKFNEAEQKKMFQSSWETDYEVVQRKFREKGYNKVPEIVFWNLRNSSSTPVAGTQTGVALVSGFSKNLLTLFLEEGGIVNPEDVLRLAIAGDEYKKLAVFD
ncbi:hypothetical protein Tsubulata_021885 [Turnera subulata]|uniref:Uncharacterized protein n=1 Tax=Turnera subulata TaxID=218843 RepID=A0A9Q0F7G8_9ROSI|nr:hypothetical protein Tsubulata_021885 [Turnera subulata]